MKTQDFKTQDARPEAWTGRNPDARQSPGIAPGGALRRGHARVTRQTRINGVLTAKNGALAPYPDQGGTR